MHNIRQCAHIIPKKRKKDENSPNEQVMSEEGKMVMKERFEYLLQLLDLDGFYLMQNVQHLVVNGH